MCMQRFVGECLWVPDWSEEEGKCDTAATESRQSPWGVLELGDPVQSCPALGRGAQAFATLRAQSLHLDCPGEEDSFGSPLRQFLDGNCEPSTDNRPGSWRMSARVLGGASQRVCSKALWEGAGKCTERTGRKRRREALQRQRQTETQTR